MEIRYGVSCQFDKYDDVVKAGYDYIEPALNDIAKKSDEEIKAIEKRIAEKGIKAECVNCFFPWEISIVGEKLDIKVVEEYAKKAFEKVSKLGTKKAVIGSGWARRVPDGFSFEKGKEQFASVVEICAKEAEKYGITIVIEPLRTQETNLINTVEECVEFCDKLNIKNVFPLADFYHISQNGETLDAVINSKGKIKHVHVGGPKDRKMYSEFKDCKDELKRWKSALEACNYSGEITLEGKFDEDFYNDILKTKELFKSIF